MTGHEHDFANLARPLSAWEVRAVRLGLRVLERALRTPTEAFNAPQEVRAYVALRLGAEPVEKFLGLYLDAQHRLITPMELFTGTLTQTSVYPREVVRQALKLNAAAVIFAHNHPSGVAEPSRADEALTGTLKQALQLVDVRVIDHIIVAGQQTTSFAERGLL